MAQNQTTKQLSDNLLKASKEVTRLTEELSKLQQGSSRYKEVLRQLNSEKKKAFALDAKITEKTRSLNAANSKHTQSLKQATQAQSQFNNAVKQSDGLLASASKSTGSFGKRLGTAVGTLLRYSLAFRAISAAFNLFNELTIQSAKRAIDFEKALGDLSAIINTTQSETAKLSDEIFRVAGSTSFTAQEIAGLQKQLGKLGSSADEIVELTRPVALLAQALGEGPDGAATALKKFLNQFSATSDEAGRFANVIVGTVNESALSLQTLGTSMQYVGPLAYQAGLTFDETASYLGVLADNGLSASRAGTGLRAVLAEAAKSGKPFAEFIEDIGNEGLNAAKALDIFGKRGAGAALVLVNNQKAVKDLNSELQDSNRLFNANAKQMATTQGQLDLLRSAYDKFSISIGDAITQTNFFVNLIGIFDKDAAGLAATYKLIANASTETKESIDGLKDSLRIFAPEVGRAKAQSELLGEAISILGDSGDYSDFVIKDTYSELLALMKQGYDLQEALDALEQRSGRGRLRLVSATKQLVEVMREQAEVEDALYIAELGRTELVQKYKDEYAGLLALVTSGTEVEAEKKILLANINQDILDLETERAGILSSGVVSREETERVKAIEEEVKNLEREKKAINSLSVAEDTLADKKKAAMQKRKDDFNRRFREIQEERDRTIRANEDRAKSETLLAKTAEEAVDIQAEKIALTSDAYQEEADALRNLGELYPEYSERVAKAVTKAENFAEVNQSDVIDEVQKAISKYSKSIKELDEKLADGTITQEEYNTARNEMFEGILANIGAFESLAEISPEVAAELRRLASEALGVAYSVEGMPESFERVKKTLKDFLEDLKDGDIYDLIQEAVEAAESVADEFNRQGFEQKKDELQKEINLVKERYEVEEFLLQQQYQSKLISEGQFRRRVQELRKKEAREQNKIDKQIFEAERKKEVQEIKIDGIVKAAEVFIDALAEYGFPAGLAVGALGATVVGGQVAGQLAAVNGRQFVPTRFAEGGIVNGPSHEQGGVPFTVQGQGGYEMEGGEFIVNKKASSLHRELLESINNSVKPNVPSQPLRFAQGGLVTNSVSNSQVVANSISNISQGSQESVNYLKAIAEATSTTAIQSAKPVRAFVTSKDLRTDATARRIKDNNTTI